MIEKDSEDQRGLSQPDPADKLQTAGNGNKQPPLARHSINQPIIPLASFEDNAIPLAGACQEVLDLFDRIKRESKE